LPCIWTHFFIIDKINQPARPFPKKSEHREIIYLS
jgi:hypothetical protein